MEVKHIAKTKNESTNASEGTTAPQKAMLRRDGIKKLNRAIAAADLTMLDLAIGLPVTDKILYSLTFAGRFQSIGYMDPYIVAAAVSITAPLSYIIYYKSLGSMPKFIGKIMKHAQD